MAIDALRTTQNPYSQYDGGASVMNQTINQPRFTGGQDVMQNYLSGVGAGNQMPLNFNTGGNTVMNAFNAIQPPPYVSPYMKTWLPGATMLQGVLSPSDYNYMVQNNATANKAVGDYFLGNWGGMVGDISKLIMNAS